ncbi:High cysteine membrane TMK-like protein [Giardia lamblia P15]|uniref:High cysteine membrane TMK-like protein n=1 Tax=Giardia intestinalis (strain P15) TaxID=658858 RepID=E1EXY2_GIAIA|nr:High cysteine membrane TMK-like protein [Giardia lamblia P15]
MILFLELIGVTLSICVQAVDSNRGAGTCAENNCKVLDEQYCAECATPGEVPINGVCIPLTDPRAVASGCEGNTGAPLGTSARKCEFCRGGNYFLHEGGCYSVLYNPGNRICRTAASGYCTLCVDGFFLGTTSSTNQCKPCESTCATCKDGTAQSCLSCRSDRFLKNNECKECSAADSGIENCAQCSQESSVVTCTLCKEKYFIKEGKCTACADNCATCTSARPEDCSVCVSKYSYDLTAKKCTQTCDEHDSQATKCKTNKCTALSNRYCSQCASNTDFLVDGQCVSADAKKVCTPFDPPNGTCSTCAKGHLLFQGGCYDVSKSLGQEVCAETSEVQERTVCVRCAQPGFVPVSGVCLRYDEQEVTAAGCVTSRGSAVTSTDTVCESCGKDAFLYKGGCYSNKTSPGNVICDELDGTGGCKVCMKKYYRSGSTCTPCHQSCETCSSDAVDSCLSCKKDVYFEIFSGGRGYCKPCNDSVTTITIIGVANCEMCSPKPSGTIPICTKCTTGHVLKDNNCVQVCHEGAEGTGKCKTGYCNAISNTYCSECATPTECPVNGICTAHLDGHSAQNGACTSCAPGYFLYNGGCYRKGVMPGTLICKDEDDSTSTCSQCEDGYMPSGNGCKVCEVSNCRTCSGDAATCTSCDSGYLLKDSTRRTKVCEKVCEEGIGPGKCIYGGCTVRDNTFCNRCSEETEVPVDGVCSSAEEGTSICLSASSGACLRCAATHLLYYGGCYKIAQPVIEVCKQDSQIVEQGAAYCKACSVASEYPVDGACTAELDGNTCTSSKCTACGPGYFMHREICMRRESHPDICVRAGAGVCEECGKSYFKNPVASTAIDSCIACNDTAGISGYTGVDHCATCLPPKAAGPATCTECADRYVLNEQNRCEESCPEVDESSKATGKCLKGYCNVLNGKYCSKCSLESDYLVDGKCVSANSNVCTQHAQPNGTCASCATTHVLYMGGCYNPAAPPGNKVCAKHSLIGNTLYCFQCGVPTDFLVDGHCLVPSSTNSAVCTLHRVPTGTCYYCSSDYFLMLGSCVSAERAPGNTVCQDFGTDNGICDTCKEGYYASPDRSSVSDSCLLCTEDNGTLKGIPHCKSCKVSNGLLVCVVCEELYRPMNGGTECVQTCVEAEADPKEHRCKKGKCDVLGTFYCSQCAADAEAPVNGVCAPVAGGICIPYEQANGTCKYCTHGYIKYRGGCYETGSLEAEDICDAQDVVTSGAGSFCARCKHKDEVPIDGECKVSDDCTVKEDGICKSCKQGIKSFQIAKDGSSTTVACFTKCPDGMYESAEFCHICDKSCKTCRDSSIKCTGCADGFYLAAERCVACGVPHCLTCSAADTCTSCQDGYYVNGNSCTACTPGCKRCDGTGCKVCKDRFALDNNACTEACPIGLLFTSCAAGYCNVNGTLACSRCALSSSVIIDGKCKANDDACIRTVPSSGTCAACKDTHILYYGGCYDKSTAAGTAICDSQHQAMLGPYAVCKQCKRDGEVPIDGSCAALTDTKAIRSQCVAAASSPTSCTRCGPGFFLHAGGCYELGRSPGAVLCAVAADSAVAGVCTSCASGYYSTGLLDPTKESCILCNNTSETNGYTGVDGCMECYPSEAPRKVICTRCRDKHIPNEDGSQCVQSCNDSGSESGRCKADGCTAMDSLYCSRCALDDEWPINGACTARDTDYVCEKGKGVCTGCLRGYMLYMGGCYDPAAIPGSGICKELLTIGGRTYCKRCNIAGEFPIDGLCTKSVPAGISCSSGLCVVCPEDYFLHEGGCYSITTAPGSEICEVLGTGREVGTCRQCRPGYRHNKETLTCMPCTISNCASCEIDVDYCTECIQPYTLTGVGAGAYCAKVCKRVGQDACSWSSCTVMDGSLCSQCASSDYVPINGVCTLYPGDARSLAGPCVKDAAKGRCTACRGNYFLYQGGCYSASEYPGTGICDERDAAVLEGQVVCGRCLIDGEVPLDGTCAEPQEGLICSKGACSRCGEGMFLFEGACYTKGRAPGTSICGDTAKLTSGCAACEAGFSKTDKGCVRCSDPNCGACGGDPNTCTACRAGYYLQSTSCIVCHSACRTCDGAGADKCKECADGYFGTFVAPGPGTCLACSDTSGRDGWVGVSGCRLCDAPKVAGLALCRDCLPGYKTLSTGTGVTCHAVCPVAYYEAAGSCLPCATDNCAMCTSTACTSCVPEHIWNGEECVPEVCPAQCLCKEQSIACTGCRENAVEVRPTHSSASRCLLCSDARAGGGWTGVDGCQRCRLADRVGPVVCLACESGRKTLALDGVLLCPGDCPADGFWTSGSECIPCAAGCLRCTSATACSMCSQGYYSTQSAVSAPSDCRPCDDATSHNGFAGVAHCAVCTADRARAAVTCHACAEGYGLSGGSCSPCAVAGCARCDGGVCTSCKRGWYLAGDRCLACPSPCATCSSATSCLACADGYFQATPLGGPQDCVPCDQTAPQGLQVAGIYGCGLCQAQAGSSTILCLRCTNGDLPLENYCGGPSTGRRLGPGAIAGISLSMVVLVGGSIGLVLGLTVCKRGCAGNGSLQPLTI